MAADCSEQGDGQQNMAKKATLHYLHAIQQGDDKTAKKYFPAKYAVKKEQAIIQPCVKQASQISLKYTTWKISSVNTTQENKLQVEVSFEEPKLESLLKKIMSEELSPTTQSLGNESLENALCKNIAHALAQVPKKKIESLGRKKSTQCFTLTSSKNAKHWVIIRQASTHCQEPMASVNTTH